MPYRFGSFVFDRQRGLLQTGMPVALEPQVFDLLDYLIEHRDRIVTKDELNDRIWNGRFVSEAALSTRIRAVRRALGDDRAQQIYIRTFPKRGFQFVASVDVVGEPDSKIPEAEHRRHWPGMVAALALALAVLVVGTLNGWFSTNDEVESAAAPPKLSIAVLPFDNLSGDPDQEYFADAITEDLITDLSRIRDALVIARRTSFTYKGRDVDIRTVAAELGVRYVLEGSVRRSGNAVRTNVQLIDGSTNSHVWSDRFDATVTDVFSAQNQVTGQIAAVLKAELREADSERQGPPASLEAWDYALRGNVRLFNPKGASDFQDAKALLDKAVELDPSIASAWSGLAFIHLAASQRPIPGVSAPNSKDLALDAAQRAVSLDSKNAEGHWIVGVAYARNGQTERAWASCETAMALNPNNDCAYVCAGVTKMTMGRPTEAVPHFRHSLRLNPRFRPFTKYGYMGLAYLQAGQDEDAIAMLHRAIAGSPNDPFNHFAMASALALIGHVKDAQSALETALRLAGHDKTTVETLRASHAWMGPGFERVLSGLRLAGLLEQ